jgi:hypothetical protein
VWLRLAESTERTVAEVERQRRVARFARTAYRLHLLKEQEAHKFRVRVARWQLRRQTESGNERLDLAGDPAALGAVRTQLALLYGAEAGTSRAAVSDLNPLRPAPRRAIAATAWRGENDTHTGSQTSRTDIPSSEARSEPAASHPASQPEPPAANPAENTSEIAASDPVEKPTAKPSPVTAKPTAPTEHPLADHPVESVRRLARAFARKPAATNSELAKSAKVSPGTANRYMAEVRAVFAAHAANPAGSQQRTLAALTALPFASPQPPVTAGINGHHHKPERD